MREHVGVGDSVEADYNKLCFYAENIGAMAGRSSDRASESQRSQAPPADAVDAFWAYLAFCPTGRRGGKPHMTGTGIAEQ